MTNDASSRAPRLVLIDGSGYIFRAFHALPPMSRPDGTPINAVFGFCTMLHRLMQDMAGDDLAVIFDAGRTSFRTELFPDYKANRVEPPDELVPQFPLVREAAAAFGLPVVEVRGFEADDLIATYARLAREAGREVLIVSSDKDLMQLVADGVAMYDPVKARPIDREEIVARFGVGPERMGDLLALAGDSSDNVPGVRGIGPKTAAELLKAHGDLESLLAAAPTIKQPKRRENLIECAELARLSRRLVSLCDTAPVPLKLDELHRRPPDLRELTAFLRRHSFKSLLGRFEAGELPLPGEAPIPDPFAADGGGEGAVAAAGPAPGYTTVRTLDELEPWLERAQSAGVLAIDTETNSLRPDRAELVGISLAVEPGAGCYIPLAHKDDFGQPVGDQPPRDAVLDRLGPVLADDSVLKVAHNLKFDLNVLARHGVDEVRAYDDTLLVSYVLDGARHGHGLDELARLHLERDTITYGEVAGTGRKRVTFDLVPVDRATRYAAEDAEVALCLHRALKRRLPEERLATVYETLERPLVPVIAAMERHGIKVDRAALEGLSKDFAARMAEYEAEAHKLAGRPFNLGSTKQLSEVLFEDLGLAGGRKTKTGAFGTGADVLESLAAQGHALPATVLNWRQLQKLTRTYSEALVEEINPEDGRVHTSFSMAVTSTGRLSSSEPNLQNIPIRTEEGRKIRRAFVPEDGRVLMSADYSQIELRILAHMAGIDALKRAFAEGVDVHAVTASQVFGVPLDRMDPVLRRNAKTINYGIIYGIGAWGLATRLGIPHEAARRYIEAYFEQYPGIRDYMDRAIAEARGRGYVTTLFGRRCHAPEIASANPARRGYAERAAINAPIQGSAADIMKRAMIRLHDALAGSPLGARMLLQVHDELVFEVPEGEVEPTADLVRRIMTNAAHLSVPLTVDIGHGANWDAAH